MNPVRQAFAVADEHLGGRGVGFALIGGFAVSARAETRFTRDVDLAVAVADDRAAESIVQSFVAVGHEVRAIVEQEALDRLATVRLRLDDGTDIDLLFASSGIEPEVVAGAERVAVQAGLTVPVASVGHLIALKLLSVSDERPLDRADLLGLRKVATAEDLEVAAVAVALITERGYDRGRDLAAGLRALG